MNKYTVYKLKNDLDMDCHEDMALWEALGPGVHADVTVTLPSYLNIAADHILISMPTEWY